MYAIIEDSGSQMKVSEGDVFEVDLRPAEPGADITFERVLMVGGDGKEARIGTPYLDGVTVAGKVIEEIKAKKLDVIKFKRRKGYRRKTGHRQRYLTVEITGING